jgi:hypothetical protein
MGKLDWNRDHPAHALDVSWDDAERRAQVQEVLAKCYVAIAEVDFDLLEWHMELQEAYANDVIHEPWALQYGPTIQSDLKHSGQLPSFR